MPKDTKPKAGTPYMGTGLADWAKKLITERKRKREEILDFVDKSTKKK